MFIRIGGEKKKQRVLKKGNYLDAFVARAIDWKEAKMLSTHFVCETEKIVARRQTGLGAKTYRLVMKNLKSLKSWAYYHLRIDYPNLQEGERISFLKRNVQILQTLRYTYFFSFIFPSPPFEFPGDS